MSITVVGLGDCENSLTLKAIDVINKADIVVVKTLRQKCAAYVAKNIKNIINFDDIYKLASDFDELNKNIVNELVKLETGNKNVVYCVPFSGMNDSSVLLLKKEHKVAIVLGVSQVDAILNTCGVVCEKTIAFSAYDFDNGEVKDLSSSYVTVVFDMDNKFVASSVKLALSEFFGDESDVMYVYQGAVATIKLFELDMQNKFDHNSAVVVLPKELCGKERFSYFDLLEIVKVLRGENGCPWDREQTHESIKGNLIEEAYELVDAINMQDELMMCEEAGDVLLQAVFHAVIAEEAGEFSNSDVISTLCKKLIFRHSHIFGGDKAENKEQALLNWEKNKKIEKSQKTLADELDAIPKSFPSLMRLQKITKKIAKNVDGFSSLEKQISFNKNEYGGGIEIDVLNALLNGAYGCVRNNVDFEVELNSVIDLLIEKQKKCDYDK